MEPKKIETALSDQMAAVAVKEQLFALPTIRCWNPAKYFNNFGSQISIRMWKFRSENLHSQIIMLPCIHG
jgi:hypothetical protein